MKFYAVFLFIKFLSLTYRFIELNPQDLESLRKSTDGSYIFGLWHQNIIGAILSQKGKPHAVVVSPSRDGELVARTCEQLGHLTARGSSSRGGAGALKAMIQHLRRGFPGAITVDGPKGPMHSPKAGVFELAYLTKVPIIPFNIYPENFWTIENSWDKFRIPKPFTKIYLAYGTPIEANCDQKADKFYQAALDLKLQLQQGERQIMNHLAL